MPENDREREEERIRVAYERRKLHAPEYGSSGNAVLLKTRDHALFRMLQSKGLMPLSERRILDVGCGRGDWLVRFKAWGANPSRMAGIDLISERIEQARRACPLAELTIGSAASLPWPDEHFDIVVQATVFSSILSTTLRLTVAREMLRVMKRAGAIVWYDFFCDNPRNPDVRGVRMQDIQELFPVCHFDLRRTTLAPPVARTIAKLSPALCAALSRIPALCTHYLGIIRKH